MAHSTFAIPDSTAERSNRFREQRAVLRKRWLTEFDIDDSLTVVLHQNEPRRKNAAAAFADAIDSGETLVLATSAEPTPDRHLSELLKLWNSSAGIHTSAADRFTLNGRYAEAEAASRRTSRRGLLTGLPVVALGASRLRTIVAGTPLPNQVDATGGDPRVAVEVALAAGFSSVRGGPISALERALDGNAVRRTIDRWRYVDELVGSFAESGVTIHREHAGAIHVSILPPGIRTALLVLEALSAMEQGVRHMTLAVGTNLHIAQDCIALKLSRKLTTQYARALNFDAPTVSVLLDAWSGALPSDVSDAYAIIGASALTGVLGGAQGIALRRAAKGVAAEDVDGFVRMLRAGITMACNQRIPVSAEMDIEETMAERECRAIVDRVLELGEGSAGEGLVIALGAGVIELPAGSLAGRAGSALPVRDHTGAVRYLRTGRLPLSKEIREFHSERLKPRLEAERDDGMALVLKDLGVTDHDTFH